MLLAYKAGVWLNAGMRTQVQLEVVQFRRPVVTEVTAVTAFTSVASLVSVERAGMTELSLADVTSERHRAGVSPHVLFHTATVQSLAADRASTLFLVVHVKWTYIIAQRWKAGRCEDVVTVGVCSRTVVIIRVLRADILLCKNDSHCKLHFAHCLEEQSAMI